MPARLTLLMLTVAFTTQGGVTPKPGLWQVNSRLTGSGKAFGGKVPPMATEIKQCLTAELWATLREKPNIPAQCTIVSGGGEKTNRREFNYACHYSPGRGLRAHKVTEILSPQSVRVETTQRIEEEGEIDTTVQVLTYTFLSDSCGAVRPETPPTAPQ